MVRISLFVGKQDDIFTDKREADVHEAASIAAQQGSGLLVLPGNSLQDLNGSYVDPGRVQVLAEQFGLAILAEVSYHGVPPYRFYVFRNGFAPTPLMAQGFVDSTRVEKYPEEVQTVVDVLNTEQRMFKVGGKRITVLICGENNLVQSHHDGSATLVNPRKVHWFSDYDLLLNPSHTTMRRAWVLPARMAFFSQGARYAFYCTNSTVRPWANSLFGYHDGQLLANGDLAFDETPDLQKHVADTWRMLTVRTV